MFLFSYCRYSRRACFWDFARHLDTLDLLLVSRVSQDNVFGIKSFLSRGVADQSSHPDARQHPDITFALMHQAPAAAKDQECVPASPLSVSLMEEASVGQ